MLFVMDVIGVLYIHQRRILLSLFDRSIIIVYFIVICYILFTMNVYPSLRNGGTIYVSFNSCKLHLLY